MQLPIKITLQRPLDFAGEELKELVISREMEANDMKGISVNNVKHDDMLIILSRLTNVPPSILGKMSMKDYPRAAAIVQDFLPDFQETGESA